MVSQSIHRKLAYHVVMRGFTLPQTLEGLNVEACSSFASSILDVRTVPSHRNGHSYGQIRQGQNHGSKIF